MTLSRHAQERMQQRGLSPEDLGLVRTFGQMVDDGYVMTNKALEARKKALLKELQRLERLRGMAVIELDSVTVTAFRADKGRIKRLQRGVPRSMHFGKR